MKCEEYKVTLLLTVEQVNQLSGLTRLYNDHLVSEGRCPICTNLKAGHLKRTRFSSFFRAKMKSYRLKIKLSIRKVYNIRFKQE